MILIFDTFGGLCNQLYDINCGINFCIIYKIQFTFRYCSFRNKDLISWIDEDFEKLFNITNIKEKYKDLYVDFHSLHLTNENTFYADNKKSDEIFTENYLHEILCIPKEYIVIKHFWSIYCNSLTIDDTIIQNIHPSNHLYELFNSIKNKLFKKNEKYNFLHYRYEHDFKDWFQINIEPLESIILRIKKKFKNPTLKIYIATSNIKKLLVEFKNKDILKDIIYKNEDELQDYNYEECGFIDYLFGLHSNEIFGHSKSSFSCVINNSKKTSNYYC
jgi:hypothetical protein